MIHDGVLIQTSVSEIETFDHSQYGGCERRWWFDRAVSLRAEQTKSQTEGEAGHAHLAHYFRTGETPTGRKLMGKAAMGAIVKGQLPAPGEDLLVEMRFDGTHRTGGDWKPLDTGETISIAGVPLDGFIDLTFRRGDVPEVWDHKFFTPARPEVSPDPYAWLKRGDELIETVQMPVYALSQMPYWPDAQRWRLVHHYVSKRGVDSLIRGAVVTRDRLLHRHAQISGVVERMKALASAQSQEELSHNRRSCAAWQGCPHQSICSAFTHQKETLMPALSPEEAALFDDLPPIDETPAAAPPPPAQSAPEPPAPAGTAAKMTCGACDTLLTPENASKLRDGSWKHIGCKATEPTAAEPPQPKQRRQRKIVDVPAETEAPATPAPAAPAQAQPAEPAPVAVVTPSPAVTVPLTNGVSPKALATLLRDLAALIDPA